MCGYVGFWSKQAYEDRIVLGAIGARMANAISHRGPDDSDVAVEPNGLTLAHRRLAVVDLSPAGHQPMVSGSGRFLIAFNGEIYNFKDLKKLLEAVGFSVWRGSSDTEVLLCAIEHWGFLGALQRISGMYSFALWDRAEKTLRLARDRLGEKPLYFGWQRGTFLFGSDLAAFEMNPDFEGRICRHAISSLLQNANVSAPLSIYEGIEKLPPGCYVELTSDAFSRRQFPKPVPYWSYLKSAHAGTANLAQGSAAELSDEIERKLKGVIKRQMVADVPVGAFLSGGIDSSTVVALAQTVSNVRVKTFTIGFGEAAYNEAEDARRVAEHLQTDHTEIVVSDRDAQDLIPSIPFAYSEPFADSSQIPTMLVSRLARGSVTVALSGDGGDEIFAGYNRYLAAEKLWAKIHPWPAAVRKTTSRALLALTPGQIDRVYGVASTLLPKSLRFRGFGDKVHKFARAMNASTPQELHRKVSTFMEPDDSLVLPLMTPGGSQVMCANWPPSNDVSSFVPWMMVQDAIQYLPDDILVKVDRAAMFYSLETRVPFLDHELIEAAWRLPQNLKIRNGQSKWVLRHILAKHVPRQLFDRPKMGFGVPLEQWLRGPLREWAADLLSRDTLAHDGYFDVARVQTLWADHLSGRRNLQHHLWPVLMFQQWKQSRMNVAVTN